MMYLIMTSKKKKKKLIMLNTFETKVQHHDQRTKKAKAP